MKSPKFRIILFLLLNLIILSPFSFRIVNINQSNITNSKNSNLIPSYSSDILLDTIALWSGPLDSIPNGWVLCNGSNDTPDLTNRFVFSVKNGENPGNIGGSKDHNHSYDDLPQHLHDINDPGHRHGYKRRIAWRTLVSLAEAASYDPESLKTTTSTTGITINEAGMLNCKTNNSSSMPPYYKLVYIMKKSNEATFPDGLILMWSGSLNSIPEGWALCNGIAETPNLTDRFILGVNNGENPGIIGGSKNHNHSYEDLPQHLHDINDPGHDHIYEYFPNRENCKQDYYSQIVDSYLQSRTESTSIAYTGITINKTGISNCTTDNISSLPPYYKLAYIIKKSNEQMIPKGVILMWSKNLDSLPEGLNFCNGSESTPNLTDRFIFGVMNGEDPGSIGGNYEHNHTYGDLPRHTHTINDPGHNHNCKKPYPPDMSKLGLMPIPDYYDGSGYTSTSYTGITMNYNGTNNCITDNASSVPPYYKLAFIMADDSIIKIDKNPPDITIHFPHPYSQFGRIAPKFNFTINDLSPINATWYTIDGGLTNYTFSGLTGNLNQIVWETKGTEIITLRFYANDSLGNVGFKDIDILKDLIAPNIVINSPIQDGIFGNTSPEFNISIIEENLVSTWYTLEGVAGTISFTGLNGTIHQGEWDSLPQGEISITFYAEDEVGNIGSESVIVLKRIQSQQRISGYNISIILLGFFLVTIIMVVKKKKNSKY